MQLLSAFNLENIELTNLSTFTQADILYHRLTLKLIKSAIASSPQDHRYLNKSLNFFHFDDQNGSGLPF